MARVSILIVTLICGLLVPLVSAQGPPLVYAVTHLNNDSNAKATIYFKYKRDNGPWERHVLERGRSIVFSTNIRQGQSQPPMLVRFDIDTHGGTRYVEHELSRGLSPDQFSQGHHFSIKQLPGKDTRYLASTSPGANVRLTGAEGRP